MRLPHGSACIFLLISKTFDLFSSLRLDLFICLLGLISQAPRKVEASFSARVLLSGSRHLTDRTKEGMGSEAGLGYTVPLFPLSSLLESSSSHVRWLCDFNSGESTKAAFMHIFFPLPGISLSPRHLLVTLSFFETCSSSFPQEGFLAEPLHGFSFFMSLSTLSLLKFELCVCLFVIFYIYLFLGKPFFVYYLERDYTIKWSFFGKKNYLEQNYILWVVQYYFYS